ncbi:LacI family DNA-binding transcriptional regulator [Amycolatopsis balhimycina]|nr:LacI family DNA-binding transcriptional regulator [Amycolatopsis balhimycina]
MEVPCVPVKRYTIVCCDLDEETMRATDPRSITIRDVAREAGVSPAAVSKVLNNAYGVSDAMRERVTAATRKLGYRPKPAARAMRGRSYTIGVLLADVASPFAPMIVDGIQREIDDTGLQVLLGPGGASPERQQRSIEAMVDRQMDGLILIAPNVPTTWLETLAEEVPVVVIARHGRGRNYDSVVDDDVAGAELVVKHLSELGHEHITHIAHPIGKLRRPSVLSHTAREDGYCRAMTDRGLVPHVVTTSYTEEGGYTAAMAALRSERPPTAIFAGADVAAFGVLRAAAELGLDVPGDVSVVGYDNVAISGLPQISLTTVDQSGELTGSMSARLLRERLDGRDKPVTFSVSTQLVERRSTAVVRPADPSGGV